MSIQKNRFVSNLMEALYSRLTKRVRRLAAGGEFVKNLQPYSKTVELAVLGKTAKTEADHTQIMKLHETQCSEIARQNMDLKCIISRQGAELLKADTSDVGVAYIGETYLLQLRLARMLEYIRALHDDVSDLTRKRLDSRYALRPSYRDSQEALLRRMERRVDDLKADNSLIRMQLKGIERQIAAATGVPYVEEDSEYEYEYEYEDSEELPAKRLSIGIHNVFAMLASGDVHF